MMFLLHGNPSDNPVSDADDHAPPADPPEPHAAGDNTPAVHAKYRQVIERIPVELLYAAALVLIAAATITRGIPLFDSRIDALARRGADRVRARTTPVHCRTFAERLRTTCKGCCREVCLNLFGIPETFLQHMTRNPCVKQGELVKVSFLTTAEDLGCTTDRKSVV